MNFKIILLSVFTSILCFANSYSAHAEIETVRGFLIDMKIVKQLTDRGATGIKIYAAADDKGTPYYIMAGLDNQGAMIAGQVYRQNESGDCPPSCDFLPSALENGGSFISVSEADALVNNYMTQQPEANNAVVICAYSINKVVSKEYHYMRVTFEKRVKVTGVKDDGGIRWFAPFTHSCNNLGRSALTKE